MAAEYLPGIFHVNNIEFAKQVILTQEGDATSEERWKRETPYLVKTLLKSVPIKADTLLLDFGCGIGRLAKPLIEKTNCHIVGSDLSISMLAHGLTYVDSANFAAIPSPMLQPLLQNGLRFDGVIACWVFQHCLEPQKEINGVYNAIRPGGFLFVVNNHHRALPTTKGWVDDGIDVMKIFDALFEREAVFHLPTEISDANLAKNTFIHLYRKAL